jgi:hypothetical protein
MNHTKLLLTMGANLHTRVTFRGRKEIFRGFWVGFGFPHNKQKQDEPLPPYPQHLCPILPWQHLPWYQIMALQVLMIPSKAPGGGFAIAAAGTFAWGTNM